jgi:predicted metal-dependent hydrolase
MSNWRDKTEFKERVLAWASKLGVPAKSVAIRPMSTKWASCSTGGQLTFNCELLSLSREVGDYVIVHELLHFQVPNHGKLWKALMTAHLGDYSQVAASLPARGARHSAA